MTVAPASRRMRLVSLGATAALLTGACGSGSAGDGLKGSIVISGSSTVEPISVAVAEKFVVANPGVAMDVAGPGTGDGFQLFCNGETDISDASRPIKSEEEVPLCKENGIDFLELKVAIDGLSVITSPQNDRVDCLDFKDLYALLGIESRGFNNWSDANQLGEELGAQGVPYPDAPLAVTAPGEESGTFDSFVEIVLEPIAVDERGQPEEGSFVRPDYQAAANDSVIIDAIAGSPTSLGWVGYAFYRENADVKALQIADAEGGGCVEPTEETISSGEYPIARDLFIYVNKQKLDRNEALAAYVDYYLSDEGIASVSDVGYVELAPEDLQATRNVWRRKKTGTREG